MGKLTILLYAAENFSSFFSKPIEFGRVVNKLLDIFNVLKFVNKPIDSGISFI